ncbi:MAG: transposase [Bacteroidia bacterium]|nr:transposase [Bacteroidia bacterium]
MDNWAVFVARVALICQLILRVLMPKKASYHLLSVDEKTGIQALERIRAEIWMCPGKPTRVEREYKRHGTTSLMAAIELKSGKVAHYRIHPTRKEDDF